MRINAISVLLSTILVTGALNAQTRSAARTLVTQAVDENKTIRLEGNTRPEAKSSNDRGAVAQTRRFEHMSLLLNRPAERETALQQYLADLSDASSPTYHKWLTAKQIGDKFGPNPVDIEFVKTWLASHGLTVNSVSPTGMVIDFSGNARQLKNAFRTEIHRLSVRGVNHVANMSDPMLPAALGDVVKGITSLNNFFPRPLVKNAHPLTTSSPEYTSTGGRYLVAPADLATIYNANPLYSSNLSGQGQTIVLLERTNVVSAADWLAFRKRFALTKAYPYASLAQIHPATGGAGTCSDPGVSSDDVEADLDIQWASAAAPNANIVLASCADTDFNFGPFIALENLLTGDTAPPSIASLSYGGSETSQGAAFNYYTALLYQVAALEGVSVFVSSGDNDAAIADDSSAPAVSGINVNSLASTPYNVAVGGTDFGDTFLGNNTTYWNSTNAANGGSAKSYVPEIPWNSSCGGSLVSLYLGYATAYGTDGLCNSADATTYGLLNIAGGSGGPSACAFGSTKPSDSLIVSGSCAGYNKPAWQSLVGVPNDGVRDLPDISLFAANGLWGHYYLFCYSDVTFGGVPCSTGLFGAGGTSFGAPIMAGYQALINQYTGSAWGNPNPVLYSIARKEYGKSGNASCNSTLGNAVSNSCTFHDITLGDIVAVCVAGSPDCYAPSGTLGVLSTSKKNYKPAYTSTTGWDFATGIGSFNVYNLVTNWLTGTKP